MIKSYTELGNDFPASAYAVRGHPGVAWRVLGWEIEPVAVILCPDCDYHAIERNSGGGKVVNRGDKDCEHAGAYQCEEPDHEHTGRLVCVMVGDDGHWTFSPDDLSPLKGSEFCSWCGQIGCACGAIPDGDEE